MTGLLERLLDYRAVMNDENKTYSMSCTVNLLVGTYPMPPAPRGQQGSAPRPSRSPRGCGAPGTAEMGCTQCQTRIPLGDACWWALGSSPLQGQPSPCMGRVTQSKAQEPGRGLHHVPSPGATQTASSVLPQNFYKEIDRQAMYIR